MLSAYLSRDSEAVPLPEISAPPERPGPAEQDTIDRIEATRDTIQAIIAETLSRPETYSRDVTVESIWDGGHAEYNINVSVTGGMTSLRVLASTGAEKRIIVTPETLYIWYTGDSTPYAGDVGSGGDAYRTSDEWQMLITYEDVIKLDKNDIIEAGYTEYGGEACLFVNYRSPLLGYTGKYYVSIELGLVTGAEEYDEAGALVYRMQTGECAYDTDQSAFTLPDGTLLGFWE